MPGTNLGIQPANVPGSWHSARMPAIAASARGGIVPASRSRGFGVQPVAGPEGSCVITCHWCGRREQVDGGKPLVAQIRSIAVVHEDCEPDR